jgi:uncharacterized protein (TIGR03067 family)
MRLVRGVMLSLVFSTTILAMGCVNKLSNQSDATNSGPPSVLNELLSLRGTWKYEKLVVDGKERPIGDIRRDSVIISENSMTRIVHRADGTALPQMNSIISVDPTTNPKQMDEDVKVGPIFGQIFAIYKLEGDRLTLCFHGVKRPTTFDSAEGSTSVFAILKRVKK